MLATRVYEQIAWRSLRRCVALAFVAGAALVAAAPPSATAQDRGGTVTAAEAANIPEVEPDLAEAQRLRDAGAADRVRELTRRFRLNAGTADTPGATEQQLRQALFDHASEEGDSGVAADR